MKFLFSLFLLTLFLQISPLAAQEADSTIWYIADWKKGDSRQYKITKKNTEVKNGEQTKNTLNAYLSTIRVTKAKKKYYELEWTFGKTLESNSPALSAGVIAATRKHNIATIIYRTDPYGAFSGIENWKKISKMMEAIFKELTTEQAQTAGKDVVQATQSVLQVYSTKQGLEQNAFKEVAHFHSPFGAGFERYDTVTYEDQMANLYGGNPIKANGLVYYINPTADTTTLVNELRMDPDDSRRMVEDFITRMSAGITSVSEEDKQQRLAEFKKSMATMEMNIHDYHTFVFDNSSSWPVRVTFKRTIRASGENEILNKTEEISIELVP